MIAAHLSPTVLTKCSKTTNVWSLSDDIRNYIYKLAITPAEDNESDRKQYSWVDGKPVIVLQSFYADKYGWDPDLEGTWWLQPAITKVNRRMRAEALPLYYGTTAFVAYGAGYKQQFSADFWKRTRHIGDNMRFIKHFSVLYAELIETNAESRKGVKRNTIEELVRADGPCGRDKGVPRSAIKVKILHTTEETRVIKVLARHSPPPQDVAEEAAEDEAEEQPYKNRRARTFRDFLGLPTHASKQEEDIENKEFNAAQRAMSGAECTYEERKVHVTRYVEVSWRE